MAAHFGTAYEGAKRQEEEVFAADLQAVREAGAWRRGASEGAAGRSQVKRCDKAAQTEVAQTEVAQTAASLPAQ
ncbi:hypothetical protein JCM10599A_22760 [Paraburkholderia kururiensis]